jgi:tetratricopeptide (TPR) repeat protein
VQSATIRAYMTMQSLEPTEVKDELARVHALYQRGKLIAAFEAGRRLGPLASWPGTEGRVLAGRLAGQLGARRISDALFLRAVRADPNSELAGYYHTSALLSRRGAFAALEALRRSQFATLADRQLAGDWYGLAAHIYGHLRDFDTAEANLAKAFELAPSDSYRWVERSALFELEDEYVEALNVARRSMDMDPASRASIMQVASLLMLHDRGTEARELLRGKLQEVESAPLAFQLAHIEYEAGDYVCALGSLEFGERLAPIPDKSLQEYLAQRRCDAYLRLGDSERALQQARLCVARQYQAFVERIESGKHEARRTQLAVAFVRQHHMTCAPATLTAISQYWSKPVDHLEVAEDICYDGTPHASERRWAVEHGYVAREFRVDWDSAQALIDRGVPFTLTTVYPASAHLQAVIGYDALRGTLVIRDPMQPTQGEFAEKPLFGFSAANGPRGMLLVPVEQAQRVADLSLPEAQLYDLLHEMQCALTEHRRDDALSACTRLAAMAPGHRIALEARRSLANYDANHAEMLAAVDQLLRLYPEDIPLRLHRAALIGQLRPQAEYIAYLQAQIQGPASDAMFELRFAQALLADARKHVQAVKLLKRVLRSMPFSAETFATLANFEWEDGASLWATELYRLASTLEITNEGAAQTYFRAARQVREHERALEYLHSRVRRLGHLSSAPVITLFRCPHELDRTPEALDELNAALARDPDDAALALFAAGALASLSDFDRVWPLLSKAEPRSRRIEWLRTAVSVQRCTGDLAASLAASRELVERLPLDLEAQSIFARLLEEVESRAAVLLHLRGVVARFPHHAGLNQLLVEWLFDEPLEVREQAIRNLLQVLSDHAWARRELAITLARQQRFDEAYAELEHARALAPDSPLYHSSLAYVHMLRGDHAAARSAHRAALAISVDLEVALHRLMDACAGQEERRAQLAYVHEQLKRQVTRGEGMLTFQELARATYEPDELLAILNEGLSARPDLWHAWVSVARQLASINRLDEAEALCDKMVARFPLLPRVHVERAEIRRLRANRAGEREALQEALRLSTGWSQACISLADSFEADGRLADSRAVIESAIRHSPTEAYPHGYLADMLWRQGERKLAVDRIVRALQLDPGYEWGWQTLKAWGEETGEPERAVALARELSASRPAEFRVWWAIASIAPGAQERMRAAERTVQLAPLSIRAHRRRLQLLMDERRYDEAFAVLGDTPWGETLPIELRAERARLIAAQGDLMAAVGAMRELLVQEPRYAEGWRLISDWHAQIGDARSCLEAAEQLHRLTPNDPVALGCLAEAHRKQSSGVDVRPWLERALELRPAYTWAAAELFDHNLQADDLDAAAAALAKLKVHSHSPATLGREIALLARRGEKRDALNLLRELLRVRGDDGGAIQATARALFRVGWHLDLLETLDIAVHDHGTHPAAGSVWVWTSTAIVPKHFFLPRDVLENGSLGRNVAGAYLEFLAQKRDARRVHRFIREHRAWLRADTMSWATTGYALFECLRLRETCEWLADWPQREGLQAWMLFNLVGALRGRGLSRQAAKVGTHAISLPRDRTIPYHCVWLAADAALLGRSEEASQMLAKLTEKQLDPDSRCLWHLTRAVLRLEEVARPDRATSYRAALDEVRSAAQAVKPKDQYRALRRYANRALWRIALMRTRRPAIATLLWLWLRMIVA